MAPQRGAPGGSMIDASAGPDLRLYRAKPIGPTPPAPAPPGPAARPGPPPDRARAARAERADPGRISAIGLDPGRQITGFRMNPSARTARAHGNARRRGRSDPARGSAGPWRRAR